MEQEIQNTNDTNYLLSVTFHAGSDTPKDTDKGLFIITVPKQTVITEDILKNIFKEVNRLCDPYSDDEDVVNFEETYENGLNIHTLMKGFTAYTKYPVTEMKNDIGHINIANYYEIEQWQ